MTVFYVYQLADPQTGLAYYVGKGKGSRLRAHTRLVRNGKVLANPRLQSWIQSLLDQGLVPVETKLIDGLDEASAYHWEHVMVALMGRKHIDPHGVLLNLSEGGDGCRRPAGQYAGEANPFFGKRHTDESRRLISQNSARVAPMKGKKHTLESRKQMSESASKRRTVGRKFSEKGKQGLVGRKKGSGMTGKTHSEETKQLIRDALKRRRKDV